MPGLVYWRIGTRLFFFEDFTACMLTTENEGKPRRELDLEIDRLEARINELRVLYEQHFVDILPYPPDKERKEVEKMIRGLLRKPFKNSQTRFRLRHVIHRYQSYKTYWERVNKQREDGTYFKDVFRAEVRERMREEAKEEASRRGAAQRGMRNLYSSYQEALKKTGSNTDNVNFDAFQKTLVHRAKQLKKQHGIKKLQYKIVMKNGKVTIKASGKS